MSRLLGYINNEFNTLRIVGATAVLESGAVSGLSSNAVAKINIPNLSVIPSISITQITLDGLIIYGEGIGRKIATIGNTIYFETQIQNDQISGKSIIAQYVISTQDFEIVKMNEASVQNITQQYMYLTSGNVIYRIGVRNETLVKDVTLTPLGFNGTKDLDWENLEGETI